MTTWRSHPVSPLDVSTATPRHTSAPKPGGPIQLDPATGEAVPVRRICGDRNEANVG